MMTNAVEKKAGRPSSFTDKLVLAILEFAKTGATDSQIAATFGFAESTLYAWKGRYPTFAEALKEAKDFADEMIEISLFRRAVGYQHPDLHFSSFEGCVTATPYVKCLPPDTSAAIFLLKNRQPDKYRDVQKIDVTAEVKHTLPTPQEAKQILEADYAVLPAPEVKVDDL